MKKTPNVILRIEYVSRQKSSKEKNFFYRQGQALSYSHDHFGKDKIVPDEKIEQIKAFLEFGEINKSHILGYSNNRTGSTGVFTENGKINNEEMKNIEDKMKKTESIIWTAVLSFETAYGNKYMTSSADAQACLNNCLENLFKKSHLKYENIDWWAAMHNNTDNNHIHFVFWEKEKIKINSKGEKIFNNKCIIDENSMNNFKFSVARYFADNDNTYFRLRDDVKTGVGAIYKTEKNLLFGFILKNQDIVADDHYQYKRLSSEQKTKVNNFIFSILKTDASTFKLYEDYLSALKKKQLDYIKLYKDNNIKPPKDVKNFYDNRFNDFNFRLGNHFLKQLKNFVLSKPPLEYNNPILKNTPFFNENISSCCGSKREKEVLNRFFRQLSKKAFFNILSNSKQIIVDEIKTTKDFQVEKIMKGEEIIFDAT